VTLLRSICTAVDLSVIVLPTEPVSKKDCPHYYSTIEHPIDLTTMQQKALDGRYNDAANESTSSKKKALSGNVWEGELIILHRNRV
jgi:hypothetical protein